MEKSAFFPSRSPPHDPLSYPLLPSLFGEQQFLALADYLEASLKLNYNKRRVG